MRTMSFEDTPITINSVFTNQRVLLEMGAVMKTKECSLTGMLAMFAIKQKWTRHRLVPLYNEWGIDVTKQVVDYFHWIFKEIDDKTNKSKI